jgi:hypothetical protein
MIHDEICTYEVCKLAKEKGFNEYEACNHIYEDDEQWYTLTTYTNARGIDWSKDKFTVAPTQSLLQRWLREEKDVQIVITPSLDELGAWRWGHYGWVVYIYNEYQPIYYSRFNMDNFCTYEKSLEDALEYALENLV